MLTGGYLEIQAVKDLLLRPGWISEHQAAAGNRRAIGLAGVPGPASITGIASIMGVAVGAKYLWNKQFGAKPAAEKTEA